VSASRRSDSLSASHPRGDRRETSRARIDAGPRRSIPCCRFLSAAGPAPPGRCLCCPPSPSSEPLVRRTRPPPPAARLRRGARHGRCMYRREDGARPPAAFQYALYLGTWCRATRRLDHDAAGLGRGTSPSSIPATSSLTFREPRPYPSRAGTRVLARPARAARSNALSPTDGPVAQLRARLRDGTRALLVFSAVPRLAPLRVLRPHSNRWCRVLVHHRPLPDRHLLARGRTAFPETRPTSPARLALATSPSHPPEITRITRRAVLDVWLPITSVPPAQGLRERAVLWRHV